MKPQHELTESDIQKLVEYFELLHEIDMNIKSKDSGRLHQEEIV